MHAIITDCESPDTLQPLSGPRLLSEQPVANMPLREAQRRRQLAAGFTPGSARAGLRLIQAGDSWLSTALLDRLRVATDCLAVTDAFGTVLAWIAGPDPAPAEAPAFPAGEGSFKLRYPWDLLRVNEDLVGSLGDDRVAGDLSERAAVEGHLWLGQGSRVLPGVFIEGNVVIGRNCKIGPNCYLRGNTSIGEGCHIGQGVEIKNSIVMDHTGIGHLSYCGDSIIGRSVNFGAGTIIGNLRHDGANHRSMVGEELIDTGRRKFGSVVGDGVHTGINTSIYPGRKLWPGAETRPGEVVRRDIRRAGSA